jgi:hypothetical protein
VEEGEMSERQRTAPRVYGTLEVVCGGREEWCGQAVPLRVEIPVNLNHVEAFGCCPRCGREHAVEVIERRFG